MSRNRFTDEFKRDAVAQVVDRGYAVSEVADRLGISTKSLYTWKARLSKPANKATVGADQSA
ncbi:MAG: transposase, partial [Rhodobacteraceae bacterium]|nr:transposase [Paracoccaceae bacterium]